MAATAGLIISALAATAGAGISAYNNKQARDEENRRYKEAQDFLRSQYYRDPLSTVGNRALLKSLDQRMKDQNDALQNRAIAGGATMENQLAARQASNETMGNVFTNLLMGEDARRDSINAQRMGRDDQHSAAVQQGYYQNAQDWQTWGAQMANAAMSYGSSSLLGK